MSGNESEQTSNSKKRRLQNACDECRRRKIKCDSGERPANICSNCIAFRLECTHALAMAKKKRGPPKGTPRGHRTVQSLVASILNHSKPFIIPNDPSAVYQILIDLARHIRSVEDELANLRAQQTNISLCGSSTDGLGGKMAPIPPGSYIDIDGAALEGLSDDMKKLTLDLSNTRHFGNSSNIMLVKTAMSIKREYNEERGLPPPHLEAGMPVGVKRKEFWTIHPWQIPPPDPDPPYSFPPTDLMHDLITLFFAHTNQFTPLLHRPSFERSIADGLHLRNRHFGALVLSVCASASRMSEDPRVYCDEEGNSYTGEEKEDQGEGDSKKSYSPHSAGWQWIRQIRLTKNWFAFTEPPSLYEVQMLITYVMFMYATSTPEVCWILVGLGIRYVQDVGAHRKRSEYQKPTVEGELWKRAFWALYVLDIFASAFLGRPRAISSEDFDVDYPIECDDEYWEHPDPALAFKQPEGKPSSVSHWIAFLKLADILGIAQRTIFSVRRRECRGGGGSEVSNLEWSERIVAELDSSLNKWIDSIPEHLKWNPDRTDMVHFKQSSMLHATYYWIQIQIHRPFIPIPGQNNILSFPSLAICANAARSCAHVIEVLLKRAFFLTPNLLMALFNAAIMLLLNIWRGRKLKPGPDIDKAFSDVYKCMDMIRVYEHRWQAAGRLWDILYEIVSVTHQHHDQTTSSLNLKRQREAEDDLSPPGHSSLSENIEHEERTMAGTRRVSAALASDKNQFRNPNTYSSDSPSSRSGSVVSTLDSPAEGGSERMFTLPVHSDELGSLPVHTSFHWSDSASSGTLGAQSQFTPSQFTFGRENWSYAPSSTHTHTVAPAQSQEPLRGISSTSPSLMSTFVQGQNTDFDHFVDGGAGGLMNQGQGASHGERFWADGLSTALGTGGYSVPTLFNDTQTSMESLGMSTEASGTHSDWNDWGSYMASVDEVLRAMNSNAKP